MKTMQASAPRRDQRGGFFVGLIVGLLVGLALALGVALYIAKVPVPFVNKVPQRTAEQDAAETEKNKHWDPNSALYGKTPAKPPAVSASGAAPEALPASQPPASAPGAEASAPRKDPAAILADKASEPPVLSTKPPSGALSYFVQAGAYSRMEEAEQQRAKVGMIGLQAKITEREQAGRTIYRVRVGPFDRREEANGTKEKLDGAGVDSSLVSVQR